MIENVFLAARRGTKLIFPLTILIVTAPPFVFGQIVPTQNTNSPQTKSAATLPRQFEVASIKPSKPGDDPPTIRPTLDGIRIENCTLRFVMDWMYGIHGFGDQTIVGAPKWTGSDRYDIEAKVSVPDAEILRMLGRDERERQLKLMFETLLVERFKLATHRQPIEIPVYELIPAKAGPKLKEGKPDERMPHGSMTVTAGLISAKGITMERLAWVLGGQLGRKVEDRTGLTGTYDFTLQWESDNEVDAKASEADFVTQNPASGENSLGAPIFTALQDQLGLRLIPAKGAGEALVIDRLEKPSPN